MLNCPQITHKIHLIVLPLRMIWDVFCVLYVLTAFVTAVLYRMLLYNDKVWYNLIGIILSMA